MVKRPKKTLRRHLNRLTVKRHIIKTLKPGKYVDGGGLALLVSDIGSKSWVFRFERNGRDRAMVLGSLRDLTMDDARAEATRLRAQLKLGIDPIDAKHDAKKAVTQAAVDKAVLAVKSKTFEALAFEYYDAHASDWKNAQYRAKFLNSLRMYAFPKIGKLLPEAINVALVREVIEPIWLTKNPTADAVRSRIECVLDYATALGLRSGENPARWAVLEKVLPKKKVSTKHHRMLSYREMPTFIAELRKVRGEALEFLILTAARSVEVIGAVWSEFELRAVPVKVFEENGDEDTIMGPVWVIPKERMKEGKEHRVPLSDRAVEILNGLPREGQFVFIGSRKNRPLGKNTFLDLLEVMKQDGRPHGFRSSFRTWTAQATKFPRDLCEVALSHTVGSKTTAAYQRGDLLEKRRVLMKAWAAYCLAPPKGDATVIPIRRVAGEAT